MNAPREPLAGITTKLDRAGEHLEALQNEIGAYLERHPYRPVLNVQPSNQHLILIEFHVSAEPDDHLGATIGDCIHNMRSALDHLACRLVEANGGKVDNQTQFPIVDSLTGKKGRPVPLRVSGGIAPKALALVSSLQPYGRGQDASSHPLSILRELSNADKHRLLHLTGTRITGAKVYLHFPNGAVIGGDGNADAGDETPLIGFELAEPYDPSPYGDVQVEVQGSTYVAIKESGPWSGKPVILLLDEILQYIRHDVVSELNPFLDGVRC